MKKVVNKLAVIAFLFLGMILWSCDNDDDHYSLDDVYRAYVTVNPIKNGEYDLSLDSGSKLWPAASLIPWYRPEEKTRAIAYFSILSDMINGYQHYIQMREIQTYLTKEIGVDKGAENEEYYGTDGIYIRKYWIGDDYLNIEFELEKAQNGRHFINLIPDSKYPDSPYHYQLCHKEETESFAGSVVSLVAFDLRSLNLTQGEEIDLHIRAVNEDGSEQEYTFAYKKN